MSTLSQALEKHSPNAMRRTIPMGDLPPLPTRPDDAELRVFFAQYPETILNIAIWAAFGFKNYAEREAVALLHLYNERPKAGS